MASVTVPKSPSPTNPERLAVSAKEAAAMLSVSERTLYLWSQKGIIPSLRIGGRVLYPLESLRQLVAGGTGENQT